MNSKLFIILIVGAIAGCRYENKEEILLNKRVLPDTVSFKSYIVPMLNTYCNTPGCHSGKKPDGNLNLEENVAYTSLTKRGSGYIDTVNVNYSVFYASLISKNNPMPPAGKLSQYEIKLVYRWIQQKAKNN